MKSYPKNPPIRLSKKKYHELRVLVYNRALESCELCGRWVTFKEFSLHHLNTGGMSMKGDDTLENVVGCCLRCHPD